jgi:hypothetical protein
MAGDLWKVRAAGLSCVIGYDGGEWRVRVAGITQSNGPDLVRAIVEAFGGLLDRDAALELAESVERRREAAPRMMSNAN